jgi:hypothetical protein
VGKRDVVVHQAAEPPIGVPVQKHARWLEQALYLLWKQGASAAVNYEIRDEPYDPTRPPQGQVTSGLFFNNGTRKPAYTAWRFPFVTHRTSSTQVGAWGRAPVGGVVRIQQLSQGQWQTVQSLKRSATRCSPPTSRFQAMPTCERRSASTPVSAGIRTDTE